MRQMATHRNTEQVEYHTVMKSSSRVPIPAVRWVNPHGAARQTADTETVHWMLLLP